MESCFLFIFTTMLAKFFKRPFTLVIAKVLRKWGVEERKKTVRYFYGLVKTSNSSFLWVHIVIETRLALDVKTIVYVKFRGWYQSG